MSTDQTVTPAYLEWLESVKSRNGIGGNEAWNAGVAWQALAQPVPDVSAVMDERDELRFQRDLSRELVREQAARIAELEQGQARAATPAHPHDNTEEMRLQILLNAAMAEIEGLKYAMRTQSAQEVAQMTTDAMRAALDKWLNRPHPNGKSLNGVLDLPRLVVAEMAWMDAWQAATEVERQRAAAIRSGK